MKTAEEMRAISTKASSSDELLKAISYQIEIFAKNGHTKNTYLVENHFSDDHVKTVVEKLQTEYGYTVTVEDSVAFTAKINISW